VSEQARVSLLEFLACPVHARVDRADGCDRNTRFRVKLHPAQDRTVHVAVSAARDTEITGSRSIAWAKPLRKLGLFRRERS